MSGECCSGAGRWLLDGDDHGLAVRHAVLFAVDDGGVVSGAAVDRVVGVAVAGPDPVGAVAAAQVVGPPAPRDRVVTEAAVNHVVAGLAGQVVVAGSTEDVVAAGAP